MFGDCRGFKPAQLKTNKQNNLVFLTISRPKRKSSIQVNMISDVCIFYLKKKMSFHCDCRIFLNPFLSNITTVHCRSLRYVAGDWQKSLWELCFLSGAQCNKGLNTDDYTKVHLKRNWSDVSILGVLQLICFMQRHYQRPLNQALYVLQTYFRISL